MKHIKRDSEWNTFSNLKPNMQETNPTNIFTRQAVKHTC